MAIGAEVSARHASGGHRRPTIQYIKQLKDVAPVKAFFRLLRVRRHDTSCYSVGLSVRIYTYGKRE
jgi:hypothetical protein